MVVVEVGTHLISTASLQCRVQDLLYAKIRRRSRQSSWDSQVVSVFTFWRLCPHSGLGKAVSLERLEKERCCHLSRGEPYFWM